MSLTKDPHSPEAAVAPPPRDPVVLVELEELADAYVLDLLPGTATSDVELLLCGRCLTLSGWLAPPTPPVAGAPGPQAFRYDVLLPDDIDVTDVTASRRRGALTVRVGRTCTMRPRRIRLR
jgi:HSP20 family molecular chaperone IbpA